MAHIFAFMTATVTTPTGREAYGWIDPNYSRTVLLVARNDARPVVDTDSNNEDLPDLVREALENHLGVYFDNGDGTFYSEEEFTDSDGWSFTYALNFVFKDFGPEGYYERPWHPVDDGGITL